MLMSQNSTLDSSEKFIRHEFCNTPLVITNVLEGE